MATIYHILGSNISHHNHTLLAFFSQEIALQIPLVDHHFYVVGENNMQSNYAPLKVQYFASKWALAQVVMNIAVDPQAKFVLHGQFNVYLWLAILLGKLPVNRTAWHVWGADLYESSTDWRFKLFYPLRRLAQEKLPEIWATQGDLVFAHCHLKREKVRDKVLYFPTKMGNSVPYQGKKTPLFTILLGNSGDRTNQHQLGLDYIAEQFGQSVRVLIPMGYPTQNQRYFEQIERHSKRLFPSENVQILREKLTFEAYSQLLDECDLGLFLFERQQGIGTICALIERNIPVVLRDKNPFCLDMQTEKVPFLVAEQLVNYTMVSQVSQQLVALDKSQIRFFPPHYVTQWLACLKEFAE